MANTHRLYNPPRELPVVKVDEKKVGKGEARHVVGSEVTAILPFDNCSHVPIVVQGLDVRTLPDPQTVNDHNMKLDFLMARFKDLEIEYSGGDYGAVRYAGTASGVEFLNLTPPPGGGPAASK